MNKCASSARAPNVFRAMPLPFDPLTVACWITGTGNDFITHGLVDEIGAPQLGILLPIDSVTHISVPSVMRMSPVFFASRTILEYSYKCLCTCQLVFCMFYFCFSTKGWVNCNDQ